MLHMFAPTPTAMLLIGARDANNVLRFPGDRNVLPGLFLTVRPLVPINEQLIERAVLTFGPAVRAQVHIFQEFRASIQIDSGEASTLYLGLVDAAVADAAWQSMPEIMRSLPKDRSRLPYLQAWQILSGGLQLNTKVLEINDRELAEHFKDD